MILFLDTSTLVKLYHKETGTSEILELLEKNSVETIYLSEISRLEFASALWKKVRTKEVGEALAQKVIQNFSSDYNKFNIVSADNKIIELAETKIQQYGIAGLRALDSIQLASVVYLNQKFKEILFATDDLILKKVAKKEKLNTF